MFTLPKQLEYSLMVLGQMHRGSPGQLFSVRLLCDAAQIPFDVTSKAMQRMKRAGILRSVQGKYGGYQIVQDLGTLSMGALLAVVVGPTPVVACLAPHHNCRHAKRCTIRTAAKRLNSRFEALYAETTVLELIA